MLVTIALACAAFTLWSTRRAKAPPLFHPPSISRYLGVFVGICLLSVSFAFFVARGDRFPERLVAIFVSLIIPVLIFTETKKLYFALKFGVASGFALNAIAILANGGLMPCDTTMWQTSTLPRWLGLLYASQWGWSLFVDHVLSPYSTL